ncbi:hypothetical protein ACE2AJ_05600 [Aquihabitans daechungensis]|uniref:hypothetical protein n=1 Tax=Aquihabitans daechungensis TaxID=1052257 RepID=UPI003BA347BC
MTARFVGVVLAFDFVMPPWWGILLAIVLVVLGGIIATSYAGPNLAAVGVSPDDVLLVRPVGLVRLWALSKGHECPVTAITDVGVSERKTLVKGWRFPGTHLPGVMTAGTFRAHGDKDLWMVGRAKEVLVIELHDQPYRHLIVQVEDPHAAVEALRAAMNRER